MCRMERGSRMTRRIASAGVLTLALVASMTHAPAAYAAGEFPITVTPTEALPGDPFTVTGDATDPTCADDGVAVSLFYTKPDGSSGSVSVNTITDSAGHFEAALNVPETAVAGADATVTAAIADCTPPSGPTSSRASISVPFEVLAYEGAFSLSKTTGKPGETISFIGENCWGGDVVVFFGDLEVEPVTLNGNKTFTGDFVLPDAPGGVYEFGAECPGTDYEVLAFTLVNPAPAAPPAAPVPGRPRFTG